MNKRNSHNSILILTTLGVYLGLVLAGAAPQLVAQSATLSTSASQTHETDLNNSVVVYLQDVEGFLAELQRLRTRHGIDLSKAAFAIAQSPQTPNITGIYLPERLTSALFDRYSAGPLNINNYVLTDHISHSKLFFPTTANTHFLPDTGGKDIQTTVSTTFEHYRRTAKIGVRSRSVAAAAIIARNDQIFLAAQLPRSAIDPLPASFTR